MSASSPSNASLGRELREGIVGGKSRHRLIHQLSLLLSMSCLLSVARGGETECDLPEGVKAVWDLSKAFHNSTSTRERVCINGLWRWQPAAENAQSVPSVAWGFYKVPACWPGVQDYMQSDYQTLYKHPAWKDTNLAGLRSAWYEREIIIPETWSGRRIGLEVEYLNSFAMVFIDGKDVGHLRFPAGKLDLTDVVRPGTKHMLSLWVMAMPLRAVMDSFNDTNSAKQRKGTVERRGLCGDVWLCSEPSGPRLGQVRIATSVRKGEVTFSADVRGLSGDRSAQFQARISERGRAVTHFVGPRFSGADLTNGCAAFTVSWTPPKLWDIHTPGNQYTAELSLVDANAQLLDAALPVSFGFREFWSEGRDFYLNGRRIFLSLVPLDNAQVGAALATYTAAKESFQRLQSFGINFVYTHNYGCEPGSHLSFEEILRAADDTGMLVALSQPHFSAYDWKAPEADATNGYAAHASFYVGVAGTHPSVVSYSMSHNATGYNEDMNPLMIDGLNNPRDQWASRNAALALRCERIVKALDPTRLVYHHSSGNLSGMHTVNFYPNFAPIQELDDWFEHWSTTGVEPVLLVEYGAPFGWDWTMYRGWFDGKREFGSADVPWEYCLAEWNAQFLGDSAYQLSDRERRNLRWEARQFRERRGWRRWDYPFPVGDRRLDEMQPVQAAYTTSNWRAFRTWGLSGNSPWEHDRFWKIREGFQPRRQDLPVDWDKLQRPGYSPDFIDRTYARYDLAYNRTDWVATRTAEALLRNNGPVLAWLAGPSEHFTSKEHIFYPGEIVAKQLIIINNSRLTLSGDASWCTDLPGVGGVTNRQIELPTGQQLRLPIQLRLPRDAAPGRYQLQANFRPTEGASQSDTFNIQVLAPQTESPSGAKLALFDPLGQTAQWLRSLDIEFQEVEATGTDFSGFDALIIGKGAITPDGPVPAIERVRDGLKVLVFEQTADALEQRLGFRVAEYGLRQVWCRVPDSPALDGITSELLRDWRGAATLLPTSLNYTLNPKYNGAPTVRWCGLEVTRLWRCGNRGNVSSALIEKPTCGDFLPILEGGYALQYSPLLEYREGQGLVLFCQLDVTGRTESEPAAELLTRNLLRYVKDWCPSPPRGAVYTGETAGLSWLKACGLQAVPFKAAGLESDQVLVIGPGGVREMGDALSATKEWIKGGGRVVAVGLDETEANLILPSGVHVQPAEYISAHFAAFNANSFFAGISPADVHNRDPRVLPLINGGASAYGGGVLGQVGSVAFFQLPPWAFDQKPEHFNQRRTFVRTSCALNRLLANHGVRGTVPLLARFASPFAQATASSSASEQRGELRCATGLYLTQPTEWDDPYRFFRW